jgi:DHA1 family bicyclomycin/chloramphenicol resistance-like MFS transporter
MLLCGLSQAAAIVYLPATAEIQKVFGVDETSVQLMLTAFIIPFAAALPFVGPLSDRFGRRPLIVGATALFFVSNLLAALAPTFGWLMAARVLQGLAACPVMILPRAMVRDLGTGQAAARALTYTAMALSLAQVLAPIAGGLLIKPVGWSGGFFALALLTLPGLAMALRLPETATGGGAAGQIIRSFTILLTMRRFLMVMLGVGLLNGAFYAFFTAAPIVYMRHLGYTAENFSFLMMMWGISFFITGMAVTRSIGRIDANRIILAGSALNILTACYWIVVISLELNPLLMIGPVIGFAAANALYVPRGMNLALAAAPVEIAGAASALIALSQWIFSGVGSGITAMLPHDSPVVVAGLILVFVLLSLLCYLLRGPQPDAPKGI